MSESPIFGDRVPEMKTDFEKAFKGEPNPSDQSAIMDRLKRANYAHSVLSVLRHARDNAPDEWDALMQTESGELICKLWDKLKKDLANKPPVDDDDGYPIEI